MSGQTTRTEKALYIKNLIKFHAAMKGLKLKDLMLKLHEEYNWKYNLQNLSNKLSRGSFSVVEFLEILEALSCNLEIKDKA